MFSSTEKVTKVLFILVSALVLTAIAGNFYTFYFKKNYNFTVEAPCDQMTQSCFVRDCGGGECPPNELEMYRVFSVSASDFGKCSDNSCLSECLNGTINCEEISCGDSVDDICTVIPVAE